MRSLRALLGLGALITTILAFAPPLLAASAVPATVGPHSTAWFDASYPSTTANPPPGPPGVAADNLVVSGATTPATLPAGAPTARSATALTALAFTVPEGTSPATLTLALTSGPSTATGGAKAPTGVSVEACPASDNFVAGGHQAFDKTPTYDCTGRTSLGSLSSDGTKVLFTDIARVARGKLLSFVLRPATTGADRLVFAAPTATALTLLGFDSTPTFDPAGTEVPPPPAPQPRPGFQADPVDVSEETPAPSQPFSREPVAAEDAAVLPARAAPVGTTTTAKPPLAAVRSSDDGHTRKLALAGLALLVTSVSVAAATDRRAAEPAEWGFGRYRGPRVGRAPGL